MNKPNKFIVTLFLTIQRLSPNRARLLCQEFTQLDLTDFFNYGANN